MGAPRRRRTHEACALPSLRLASSPPTPEASLTSSRTQAATLAPAPGHSRLTARPPLGQRSRSTPHSPQNSHAVTRSGVELSDGSGVAVGALTGAVVPETPGAPLVRRDAVRAAAQALVRAARRAWATRWRSPR